MACPGGGSGLDAFFHVSGLGRGSLADEPSVCIDFAGLLNAFVNGVVLALFDVLIRLIQLPLRVAAAVFTALSSFLTDAIQVLFGASGVIEVAFVSARADVLGSGIAAFAVASLAAGGVLIVANWVIERVGE